MQTIKGQWPALGLAMLLTLPFWFAKYPGLIDYPSHLARWHVMLSDSPAIAAHYSFHWQLVGNLGTDLVGFALGRFVDIETAGRLIAGAIPAITALGVLMISRALGRPLAVGAILALLLIYNRAFLLGFMNYSLGVGLALIALAYWIKGTRPAWFIPAAVVIWLCHVAAWGVLCVLTFGYEVSQSRNPNRLISRLWPLALPALFMFQGGVAVASPTHEALDKLRLWVGLVGFRLPLLCIGIVAVVYSALLVAWREKVGFDPRTAIAAVLLAVLAVIMPPGLGGGDLADLRLAPVAVILALLSIKAAGPRHLQLVAAAIVVVQLVAISVDWFRVSERTEQALGALPFIAPGEVLPVAVVETKDSLDQSPYMHTASYATVRRDALTNTHFAVPGVHLLSVSIPGFIDPSQLVLAEGRGAIHWRQNGRVWIFHEGYKVEGCSAIYQSNDTSLVDCGEGQTVKIGR